MSNPIPATASAFAPASPDQRKAALFQAIQRDVVAGARVETQSDYNAVLRYGGKPVNHVLHLILTLITAGLWLVVWVILAIAASAGQKTFTLTVDEYGQVLRQRVA